MTASKTWAFENGHALDVALGYYYNAVRPNGAARSTVKWGVSWILP